MAYDPGLAERIRELLQGTSGCSEKKMFGGLAFLWEGHLLVGILGDVLMARIGADAYEAALLCPHVREMDFAGRPMKGYVFVDPPGIEEDDKLEKWVKDCCTFVQSLPPKLAKPPRSVKRSNRKVTSKNPR